MQNVRVCCYFGAEKYFSTIMDSLYLLCIGILMIFYLKLVLSLKYSASAWSCCRSPPNAKMKYNPAVSSSRRKSRKAHFTAPSRYIPQLAVPSARRLVGICRPDWCEKRLLI